MEYKWRTQVELCNNFNQYKLYFLLHSRFCHLPVHLIDFFLLLYLVHIISFFFTVSEFCLFVSWDIVRKKCEEKIKRCFIHIKLVFSQINTADTYSNVKILQYCTATYRKRENPHFPDKYYLPLGYQALKIPRKIKHLFRKWGFFPLTNLFLCGGGGSHCSWI